MANIIVLPILWNCNKISINLTKPIGWIKRPVAISQQWLATVFEGSFMREAIDVSVLPVHFLFPQLDKSINQLLGI